MEQLFVGFTCRNCGPCGYQVEDYKELKMAVENNKKWNLGPSALFIGVNNDLSAVVSQLSARSNAKRNGRLLLP